jgi:pyruvate ferredoxin oxidoreductase alpha subunit
LSAPITLGPDHNDVLAARDTGCVQLHAETCQEVLDSVLLGFRIAEDSRVSLPVLVNLDGFHLSFTREPVTIPDAATVRSYLPAFTPKHPGFRASLPVAQGAAVLDGAAYSYFRYEAHLAAGNAVDVHREATEDFATLFGRRYAAVEPYRLDDADTVLVMMGSSASLGKTSVNRWRSAGKRVGLLRLRMIRPWPAADILHWLAGRRAVGVLDQNLAPGVGGILYQEVAATLASCRCRPEILRSFVGGLGGKEISPSEFDFLLKTLETSAVDAAGLPSQLLMTADEWNQVCHFHTLAGKTEEVTS